jgi:hypothetical protein
MAASPAPIPADAPVTTATRSLRNIRASSLGSQSSLRHALSAGGSVDDRRRVDLDQQLGQGERLDAEHDVGRPVVAESGEATSGGATSGPYADPPQRVGDPSSWSPQTASMHRISAPSLRPP